MLIHRDSHIKVHKRVNELADILDNFEDRLDDLKSEVSKHHFSIQINSELEKKRKLLKDKITRSITMEFEKKQTHFDRNLDFKEGEDENEDVSKQLMTHRYIFFFF